MAYYFAAPLACACLLTPTLTSLVILGIVNPLPLTLFFWVPTPSPGVLENKQGSLDLLLKLNTGRLLRLLRSLVG